MKYSIIIPTKDFAANTIYNELVKLEKPENAEIVLFDNESIYLDDIEVNGEILIFATRHRAASGKKSLTCHFPGNWNKAEMGGKDEELGIAPALMLRQALLFLEQNKLESYEVVMEATHHGPYMNKPAMFIEIGSAEEQWNDEKAGNLIAKTIIHLLDNEPEKVSVGFGIGGLHYTPQFKKVILKKDIAIGHVCSKHNLSYLNEEMIKKALDRSYEKVDFAVLEWKSLGKEKERIITILNGLNIKYLKTEKLLK